MPSPPPPRRLLLRGGRLLDPGRALDAPGDLLIEGPIVAGVFPGGAPAGATGDGARVLDCTGAWVFPGAIDLWSRVGMPSAAGGRGQLGASLAQAARGGFTAVAPRPDTEPPNDAPPVTRLLLAEAHAAGASEVWPVGALTRGVAGHQLSDVAALREEGVVALSDGDRTVVDAGLFRRALEYARTFDLPVLHRGEDPALARGAVAHEGPTATRLGLQGAPGAAEAVVVARDVQLCALTGCRLVLGPLSAAESVAIVRDARARGLPVSATVAVHHLLFTDAALEGYDVRFKHSPPLRGEVDRQALRAALADGTVDAVVSGHDPPRPGRAEAPFADAPGGSDTLAHALALLAAALDREGLPPTRLVELVATGPARVLRRTRALVEGAPAAITVFDPAAPPAPDAPHDDRGERVRGAARVTIVHGRPVWGATTGDDAT